MSVFHRSTPCRRGRITFAGLAAIAASLGTARFAVAQGAPVPATATADSLAARGDSASAVAMLQQAIRANPRDAVAWHALGMLHWSMARSRRAAGFIKENDAVRLLLSADSSLRLATQFAPDSARYWMSLAQFSLESGVASTRFASGFQAKSGLESARRTNDAAMIAVAADGVGMSAWRSYETVAHRALTTDGQSVMISANPYWQRTKAKDYVASVFHKINPPTGTSDYEKAIQHFEEAIHADPTNLRVSRHLFMALAEKNRWEEVRTIARQRSAAYPLDYQSRLALGLAEQRLDNSNAARVAFDAAFALMEPDSVARITRLTRILRPKQTKKVGGQVGDSVGFAKLPAAQRQGIERMFWFMSDPLSLTAENEFEVEFIARVVQADLRWTVDERALLGADTDRGDIFVRYGPPSEQMTVGGAAQTDVGAGASSNPTLIWLYNDGLVFFFTLAPGYGTAKTTFSDKDFVNIVKETAPVRWDNLPLTHLLDTIPTRVARFRAGPDSTDAVIAARIPLDSLVRGVELDRAPVDIDLRVFDDFVRARGIESVQASIRPDSLTGPLARSWTRRLGPGINLVRVEAMQRDTRRAARSLLRLDPESSTGFGMSDVLLGSKPQADGAPKRWSDVTMTPSAGGFVSGAPVGLLWEIYDLGAKEGASKYRVSINVQRLDKGAVGRLAGRLLNGVGQVFGRTQSNADNLAISFDRSVPAGPVLLEYLSLDLSEFPRGSYRMRVETLDIITNIRTSRTADFVIR